MTTRAWKTEYEAAPEPTCNTPIGLGGESSKIGLWGGKCAQSLEPNDACYPWYKDNSDWQTAYIRYSPASVCPPDWQAQSTVVQHPTTQTLILCCPDNYIASEDAYAPLNLRTMCLPQEERLRVWTIPTCSNGAGPIGTTQWGIHPNGYNVLSTTLFAYPLALVYETTGIKLPTVTDTESAPTGLGEDNVSTGPSSGSGRKKSGGGMKIGIGIAVPIAALLIGLLLLFLKKRKKRPTQEINVRNVEGGECHSDEKQVAVGDQELSKPELEAGTKSQAGGFVVGHQELEVTNGLPNAAVTQGVSSAAELEGVTKEDSHRRGISPSELSGEQRQAEIPVMSSAIEPWRDIPLPEDHGVGRTGTEPRTEMRHAASSMPAVLTTAGTQPLGRLAELKSKKARLDEEQAELERLQRVREESRALEDEIRRLESRR